MKRRLIYLIAALLCLFAFVLGGCAPKGKDKTENEPPVSETENEPSAPQTEYVEDREVVSAEQINSFSEEYVRLLGRTFTASKQLCLANAGTGVEVAFYGTELKANVSPKPAPMALIVLMDGEAEGKRVSIKSGRVYTLASGLAEGIHTARIVKATSSQNGQVNLGDFETDGKFLRVEEKSPLSIEFVGDSITVGAGILASSASEACADGNTDATKAYAYRTAHALGADYSLVATEGICVKAKSALPRNMLEMYETLSSTHMGAYKFTKAHDVVVLALGTNDAWYMAGHADYTTETFTADYLELLTLIRAKNPTAKIVCVYGMMGTSAGVDTGIQNAIASMADENAHYLALPNGGHGAEGHPSADDAASQAEVLTNYLKDLFGI